MIVSTAKLPELIGRTIRARIVPMIHGSPGIGKSDIVRQFAKEYGLKVIDLRLSQMDPTELSGFPFLNGEKATYKPMDTFPLEGDEVPEGYNGWVLFLDELNSAPLSVQAAAYKLILDRMVGQKNLHRKVAIVAAGNLSTDKAIVNRLSTATQSRLAHFEIKPDPEAWADWARHNGIDHRVRAYIGFRPKNLHLFDPKHDDFTFPCPRTWEFLSRTLEEDVEVTPDDINMFAAVVGEGAAREFFAYTKVYNKIADIKDVMNNPTGVRIPEGDPSIYYAYSGLVSNYMRVKNADILMQFIERLPPEFQVITLKDAVAADGALMQQKDVKAWIKVNSRELM